MFHTLVITFKSKFHWFVNIKVAIFPGLSLHSDVIKNPYFLVSYIFQVFRTSVVGPRKKAEKKRERAIRAPLECS